MKPIRAKKKLGQHFLTDLNIARRIVETLDFTNYKRVLEIGPGMGVLSQFIISKTKDLYLIEVDKESVKYLKEKYTELKSNIIEEDFLKINLKEKLGEKSFAIIGNFPYNISSQIIFKAIENRNVVHTLVGMFQLEVAKRICETPGSKIYGILSVLVQAFYNAEFILSLDPLQFTPPPKVNSGVIRLTRKIKPTLNCDEILFFKIVKTSFQQRRKTLRNSLKVFNLSDNIKEDVIFGRRPETLSVDDFVHLTNIIANGNIST